MTSFITTFLIITSIIVLFMAILSYVIHRQENTKLSLHMTELWLSYMAYFVASLLTEGRAPEIIGLATIFWLWRLRAYRLILEDITVAEVGRRWHFVPLTLGYGLALIGYAFQFPFSVYMIPVCLGIALVGAHQVALCYSILKKRKLNVIYYIFLSNVLFVYLNVLYYPLLRLDQELAVLGFGLAFFTTFITAVLLPSVMFMERTKEQARVMQALVEERSQQLINQSKFSALGEMAAGIAHEINNPLAVIAGRAAQVKRLVEKGGEDLERIHKGLDNIESTSFRISRIIKSLKDFSRNADNAPMQIFDFESMIQETLDLCRERFFSQGVHLIIDPFPKFLLKGRSIQISQVLLNILNNAFDAVLGSEEKWVRMSIHAEVEVLRIRIQDSGPRIIPEIRAKIMMPFFTTKEVGKGTGIGLSISKGIIEEHKGKFYLDANDQRTSFIIELPMSVEPSMV